ncbi:MAG: hypothetical protein P0116_04005 [Candidatus Nitrosocosmicus sp.]|nr:hypothetical protein [Candidatus Nitrosocosmicus sp.]
MLINESIRINFGKIKSMGSKKKLNIIQKSSVQPSKSSPLKDKAKVHKFEIKSHLDVFNAAKNLELQGFKIIQEVGEPDFLPPIQVKNELTRIYEMRRFHYTQTAGIKDLRIGLSNHLANFSVKTDLIFLNQ